MKFAPIFAAASLACSLAHGQPAQTLPDGSELVSGLTEAASLRMDASGLLYIADPGRHVVDVRRPDGSQVFVLGGPGAGEGQFDRPMDVDPTTGLLLAVADAGNARIARFGARYEFSESIPLYGRSRETLDLSVAVLDPDGLGDDRTPGSPIAVALSESNETFAIDEVRGVVAKWDISRRLAALIGDETAGARLHEPVDLEIVGDQLFVADAARGSIVVYDLFGGYVTEHGGGRLAGLTGLGSEGDGLWALHDDRVSVYTVSGGLEMRVRLPHPVQTPVDVAVFEESVYVLTRRSVWAWPLDVFRQVARSRDE